MSRIAMLVGEGYEDQEFEVPYTSLRNAGHEVTVIGIKAGSKVHGKRGKSEVEIEYSPSEVTPEDFDAVVIPGGHGPDRLRVDQDMVAFTRDSYNSERLIAAICHGPQLLIEAEVVKGHTLTSWPSVRKDLINAGHTGSIKTW